jgi:DNA-binding transcriptional LysR family regulator
MPSIQVAVVAGLGVSILPRSSLLPGMQVLPGEYPDAGRLHVGVARGTSAKKDIIDALQRVIRQTLAIVAATATGRR